MSQRNRTVARTALFVLLAAAWAAPANAGALTLWPGKLAVSSPANAACTVTEAAASSSNGNCFFSAPIELPVGTRLTQATVSWKAAQNASVQFLLQRRWIGGEAQTIASHTDILLGFDHLSWGLSPLGFTGVDPVVRAGYRYFVVLNVAGQGGIGGVRIAYTRAQ